MSNLVWEDTKGVPQIDGLFQSYTIKNYSTHFANWLLGLTHNAAFDKRFGKSIPKINAANLLNGTVAIKDKDFELLDDEQNEKIAGELQKLFDSVNDQTEQLYKDLKCNNFEDFSKLWYGNTNIDGRSSEKSKRNYWINKNLNLFTGEMQRIGTGKGYTFIEQILELSGMIMQLEGFEGFSTEEKKELKQILEQMEVIELTKDMIKTHHGNTQVYIEAEKSRKNRKGTGEESYEEVLRNFFKKIAEKHMDKEGAKVIGNCVETIFENKKMKNIKNKESGETFKTIDAMFVNLKFSKINSNINNPIDKIVKQLEDYLKKARIMGFNDNEYENWLIYEKENPDMIKNALKDLCIDFFKTDYSNKLTSDIKTESQKMGFLGELYTHGKTFFNLRNSNKNIDVYSTGNLLDEDSKKKLGQDTILRVKGKNYGIQTKNPYETTNGFYSTYDKTYKLDSDELYSLYLKFNDEDTLLQFKQINLNLSNTIKPKELQSMIEDFLYLFADNFLRFAFQKAEDIQGLSQNVNSQLQDIRQGSQNVFFVVRGYLVESRSMIWELMEQFNKFKTTVQQRKKIWGLTYKNNIPENTYTVEGASLNTPIKYDASKIKDANLLSQVTIHSVMNIRVKPMNEKNIKRIKIQK